VVKRAQTKIQITNTYSSVVYAQWQHQYTRTFGTLLIALNGLPIPAVPNVTELSRADFQVGRTLLVAFILPLGHSKRREQRQQPAGQDCMTRQSGVT